MILRQKSWQEKQSYSITDLPPNRKAKLTVDWIEKKEDRMWRTEWPDFILPKCLYF